MHTRLPAGYDVRRSQRRQVLQPEARRLRLAVTELPRLDDLLRFADEARGNGNRVLDGYALDWRVQKPKEEPERRVLLVPVLREPAGAADRQPSTGWVGHHQIPAITDDVANVALEMVSGQLGREQVTGPRVVATCHERIPNDAGELAGDEDFHDATPIRRRMMAMSRRM